MGDKTKIEWTDSTFSPWIGCTKVSPACDHCYAERLDGRGIFGGTHWGPGVPRKRTSFGNWRKPVQWHMNAHRFCECEECGWRGEHQNGPFACAACGGSSLKVVRRRVFCASLGDMADNEVPIEWFVDALNLWRFCDNMDWLVLTKRIGNLKRKLCEALNYACDVLNDRELANWIGNWLDGDHAPANVWLGISVCNQQESDRDIPKLLAAPAAVRFLSIEPMLGPIDLRLDRLAQWNALAEQHGQPHASRALHWIIAGGESGPQARPSHPEWFRSLRDQCKAAGVPFLFKQWGEWLPGASFTPELAAKDGDPHRSKFLCALWRDKQWSLGHPYSDEFYWREEPMYRVGKSAAGRLLDGVTHNGFPEAHA